jgi:hypothetical protein
MKFLQKMNCVAGCAVAAILSLAAVPQVASANVIINGGFANHLGTGYYYSALDTGKGVPTMAPFSVPGWAFTGGSGVVNGQSTGFGPATPVPASGSFAFIQSGSTPGSIFQEVGLTAGTYDLTFDAAGRSNFGTSATYGVSLDSLIGGKDALTNPLTLTAITGQPFTQYSYVFTVGPYKALPTVPRLFTLDFFNTSKTGDSTAFISNVNINPSASPAPEPSQIGMLALMGLGLGGLMLRARRKATLAA